MPAIARRSFARGSGALGLLAASPGFAQTSAPIRAGVETDEYEGWFGQDTGFFAKAGLNVETQLFSNGAAGVAALIGGSLTVAGTNVVTVAQARDHGVPIVLIAPSIVYVNSNANNSLMVLRDSPLRSAKDLTGKTVGVLSLQGILSLVTKVWIDKNGGDSTSVQLVEVTPPQMLAAMQRGTVDAALMVDPFLTGAAAETRLLGKPEGALGERLISTGWIAKTDWVEQNRATAKTYAQVIAQIARWANDPANRDQATAIVSKRLGRNVDLGKTVYAPTFDTDPMQPILTEAYRYKYISRPMTVAEITLSA